MRFAEELSDTVVTEVVHFVGGFVACNWMCWISADIVPHNFYRRTLIFKIGGLLKVNAGARNCHEQKAGIQGKLHASIPSEHRETTTMVTMVNGTNAANGDTDQEETPLSPMRRTRGRSATTPRNGGSKSEEKTPVRKQRGRSKSIGPGAMTRRSKFDKTNPTMSAATKRKATTEKPQFRMTDNNLAVPAWKGTEKAKQSMKTNKGSTEVEGNQQSSTREVKIKREQIEAHAGRQIVQKKSQQAVNRAVYPEVELVGVKSPREDRSKAEVIDVEEPSDTDSDGSTKSDDQPRETAQRRLFVQTKALEGRQTTPESRSGREKGGDQQNKTPVANPYTRKNATTIEAVDKESEEETTPKTGLSTTTKETWANAVKKASPQRVLKTHERIQYAHEMLGEVSFSVGRNCDDIVPAIEASIFREVIIHALKRGKEVDHKFVINAYHEDTNLPTIKKIEDIPLGLHAIRAYMPHIQVPPRRVKQGKNTGYRLRMSFSIQPDEFIHYWEMSKRTYKKVPYLTLRKTPMQKSPTYNTAGFFINSSEKQCTQQLEEALSAILKTPIGLQFRPAAIDRHSQDKLWQEAKKDSPSPRDVYLKAPMALQVYAKSQAQARNVASELYAMYGKQVDGQYPRMPDGSRMRFVPASHFLDMKSRPIALRMLRQQIAFARNTIAAPIPVKDPNQRFPEYDNKTMQELILDLTCTEKDDEPYFRHVAKKWTREYNPHAFEVEIHNNMYGDAAKILRKLPEVLQNTYGKSAADALTYMPQDGDTEISQEISVITLDTEDRYMNGKAQFIFTGLETLKGEGMQPSYQEDERSMNVRSTTSGLTGHNTAGSPDTNLDSTNMEVDKYMGSMKPAHKPRSRMEEGWNRVGTEEDTERLQRRIMEAKAPDPGGTTGGQYP